MRFVVDAQLPARLSQFLEASGHEAIHTSALADGNRTTDAVLAALADDEDRVVITKDRDFRDSHLLRRSPRRLLIVAVGNVTNHDLLALFDENLPTLLDALTESAFVEMGANGLVLHTDSPE